MKAIRIRLEELPRCSKSSERRFQNILAKKAVESRLIEQIQEKLNLKIEQDKAIEEQLLTKWASDLSLLANILMSIESRFTASELRLSLNETTARMNSVAAAYVNGSVKGRYVALELDVKSNGDIHAQALGVTIGKHFGQFTRRRQLSLLTADRAGYEGLLLDFVEQVL